MLISLLGITMVGGLCCLWAVEDGERSPCLSSPVFSYGCWASFMDSGSWFWLSLANGRGSFLSGSHCFCGVTFIDMPCSWACACLACDMAFHIIVIMVGSGGCEWLVMVVGSGGCWQWAVCVYCVWAVVVVCCVFIVLWSLWLFVAICVHGCHCL